MKRILFSLSTVVLLVGCLKTRAEIEAEQSGQEQEKVTVAQQQQQGHGSAPHTVVKEKAPPAAYRFEELDEQMRQLNGRVENVENQFAQINTGKTTDKEAAVKEKAALDQKFVAYEDALRKMEFQMAAMNEEITRLKAPPPEPPAAKQSGRTVFDTAEEQFATKKWKEAITGFQKYREQNPKGKSFADATYKIGVCFQELGMKDEAKAFYEEVTSKFAGSKEAKKAVLRMKSLK